MTKTDYLEMNKPDGPDFYDIDGYNENLEILDGKIKEIDENAEGHYKRLLNVVVPKDAWEDDDTYEKYPFVAAITFEGCKLHTPHVVFDMPDIDLGIFANVSISDTDKVYIFASEKPESNITIPAIEIKK